MNLDPELTCVASEVLSSGWRGEGPPRPPRRRLSREQSLLAPWTGGENPATGPEGL